MKHRSKFLVIVDDSEELNVAIRFAAKRAQSTKGGVILLNVIEQFDPQQWQSIEDIILQEAREKAQEKLQKWSKVINDLTNICLLYTSPSPRDEALSRMPSSA